MSITYTAKFANKIDEKFTPNTVTYNLTNTDYDFVGAKTIKVTSIVTPENSEYNRNTGYGSVQTLSNTIQELTMKKDRGFKILLDKMDEEETKIKAGEVLARQLREKVIPELEEYRLGVMLETVKGHAIEPTKTAKQYDSFLKAQEFLDDNFVPANRIAFVTPAFLNGIKKDSSFIQASDLAQNMLLKGQIGEIDNVPLIKVNKAWMKDTSGGTYQCLIGHKSATIAPVKLAEYRVKTDSENYSGTLFLGRFYYDCFVLENKKVALIGIKDNASE